MTGSLHNKVDTYELRDWMTSQLRSILRYCTCIRDSL